MRRVALRFPIVIYPSEHSDIGAFTAHCLNLDIIADEDTQEAAFAKLLDMIEEQLNASEEYFANPLQSAPKRYWDMRQLAQPVSDEMINRVIRQGKSRENESTDRIELSQLEVHELRAA